MHSMVYAIAKKAAADALLHKTAYAGQWPIVKMAYAIVDGY
jgi:hypothetical protein